jgi:hypothetical protein
MSTCAEGAPRSRPSSTGFNLKMLPLIRPEMHPTITEKTVISGPFYRLPAHDDCRMSNRGSRVALVRIFTRPQDLLRRRPQNISTLPRSTGRRSCCLMLGSCRLSRLSFRSISVASLALPTHAFCNITDRFLSRF